MSNLQMIGNEMNLRAEKYRPDPHRIAEDRKKLKCGAADRI
jgi:hypothetical protein